MMAIEIDMMAIEINMMAREIDMVAHILCIYVQLAHSSLPQLRLL